MGIFGSFKKANQTIEDARRDVKKSRGKDEVAAKRDQKNQGKKK
jgi:hypothetical protein